MIEEARDLPDHALEAAVVEQLAAREQPEFVRGCAVTAGACAMMVFSYVDEYLGGYANREHAAALRIIGDSMIKLGTR